MRIPYLGLLFIVLINALVDLYIYRSLSKKRRFWSIIQLVTATIFEIGLVILFFLPISSTADSFLRGLMWVIFIYISIYIPKYIFVIFDLIARIPCLWHKKKLTAVTWTGSVLAVILFFSLWWGALWNRFNIDVKEQTVEMANLPSSFDGFRIVQISDLHVGTYGENTGFIESLVKKVNGLHPDVVFFTGDIVNRHSDELKPFIAVLSQIKAKYGVFSIKGNHDYGDYYNWDNPEDKKADNERLALFQKNMGWKLLRNTSEAITKGNDSIIVIGVENIGDPPFHRYGNLRKAYPDLSDANPKILLSHNPAHWVEEIADSPYNIGLTLSGHTHAMQMTLFGWSPVSYRYKTWGGLYSDKSNRHKLYVNIGTGTVGFPARIGATPEITVITLKKAEK